MTWLLIPSVWYGSQLHSHLSVFKFFLVARIRPKWPSRKTLRSSVVILEGLGVYVGHSNTTVLSISAVIDRTDERWESGRTSAVFFAFQYREGLLCGSIIAVCRNRNCGSLRHEFRQREALSIMPRRPSSLARAPVSRR